MPSPRSERELRPQVVNLLREYNLLKLPVDVQSLATAMDIQVREEDLEDEVSGFLILKDGKATIGVNKNHVETRRRFTISHEIGHYCLHHINNKDDMFVDVNVNFQRNAKSSTGEDLQEIEANRFAAELLMPEVLIKGIIATEKIDAVDSNEISRLASLMKVSEQAITIRLVRLDIIEA